MKRPNKREQNEEQISILEMLIGKTSDEETKQEIYDEIAELKDSIKETCESCDGEEGSILEA